ncbi:MAG: hypothetical protein ACYDCS_09135 [Candidatus Dormibacteria bacterium]
MEQIYLGASNSNVPVKPTPPTYNGFRLRPTESESEFTREAFLKDLRKIGKEPKRRG